MTSPLGLYLGISDKKPKPPVYNKQLEELYRNMPNISLKKLPEIAKKLDTNQREVERWWRKRKSCNETSKLEKFNENMWKVVINVFNVCFGLTIIWERLFTDAFFNGIQGFPHQVI